jgi:hypothetical protein
MTTDQPPNPDPVRTPDLEEGGGVSPGATPPAAPQTSGLSEPQPPIRRRHPPREIFALVAVALFALAFATTAVLLVLDMFGVFGR